MTIYTRKALLDHNLASASTLLKLERSKKKESPVPDEVLQGFTRSNFHSGIQSVLLSWRAYTFTMPSKGSV